MEKKKIQIRQIRSLIDVNKRHKLTMAALGLGKIGKTRVFRYTPQIKGMIEQVRYLIEVKELEE